MGERINRGWAALRGDWKYPAAVACLLGVLVLGFTQWRQWRADDERAAITHVVIRQNDDLRKQIDAVSATTACRAQINADVNLTFGQVVNAQGQETAAVGRMIVDLFQQDRASLGEEVNRLAAINQLATTANAAYQAALDHQQKADAFCAQDVPSTTVQEHA